HLAQMHEEGDHATKNQLSGSRLQGDGLEKRLEQWECILHDQHGRLLPQRLANGPLCHHHFAQFRRKEGTPPPTHVAKKRNFKTGNAALGFFPRGTTPVGLADALLNGQRLEDVTVATAYAGLDIVTPGDRLSTCSDQMGSAQGLGQGREFRIRRLLKGLAGYDGKYSVNPPASVQRVPCPRPRPRLAVGSVIGIPRRNLTMRRGYDVSGAGTSSSHPHARLCSGLRFHGRNRSTSSTARPPAWAHASR